MPLCRREWREKRDGMSLAFADKVMTMVLEEGVFICLRDTVLFSDLACR